MSRSTHFLEWIQEHYTRGKAFRQIPPEKFPYLDQYVLAYEVAVSGVKGKQWFFIKTIPENCTYDIMTIFFQERQQIIQQRKKFWKLWQDFMVFLYISDVSVPQDLLSSLGDFTRVRKSILGNLHEINLYFDLSTGRYILPTKRGYFGWNPIRILLKDLRNIVLEPYKSLFLNK